MNHYIIERKDTKNFHGFILYENNGCYMTEIGSYKTLKETVRHKRAAELFDEYLEDLAHEESHEDLFGW